VKISVSLKSDNNIGYFTWRPIYICYHPAQFVIIQPNLLSSSPICYHPAQFFLEWKVFQTKAVEKIKTHIVRSTFFSENLAVYEKMWKNTVQSEGPQTAWLMSIACWIR